MSISNTWERMLNPSGDDAVIVLVLLALIPVIAGICFLLTH